MNAKRWHVLPIGLIGIILILSLACQGLAPSTEVAPPKPTVESGGETGPTEKVSLSPVSAKVGELIQSGDFVMFVSGWEDVTPNTYQQPAAGNKFIAVEYTVVNAGEIPLPFSCYSDVYLKDESGQKYDQDIDAEMAGDITCVSLELNPGEKVRGKTGFQIPENSTGLQFIFDSDDWNAAKIMVNLDSQPMTVPPPESLPGEKPQSASQVGEAVKLGTLVITVNSVSYPAGNEVEKPRAGWQFILVDVTIENTGTSNVDLFSYSQMYLKDSQHRIYNEDTGGTFSLGGGSLSLSLTPGEKIRSQIVFQVPVDATGLVLGFDNDNYEPGRILIALQ